jgi:hypothetical protein
VLIKKAWNMSQAFLFLCSFGKDSAISLLKVPVSNVILQLVAYLEALRGVRYLGR